MLSAVLRARCLSRPLQRSLLSHGSSVQAPLLVRWASVPPNRLRHCGSSPTGSLGLCAMCPPLRSPWPLVFCGVFRILPLPSLSASRLRWCCHCRRHLPPSRAVCLPNHWHPFSHSATLSPQLLFSLPLSNLLAKLPGLLEHLPHFVRVVHDVGPVLVRYSRHVAVDYLHQPVSLFPHSVAFGEALLVELVACLVLSVEGLPRLSVFVASFFAGCDLSGDPFVFRCRFIR